MATARSTVHSSLKRELWFIAMPCASSLRAASFFALLTLLLGLYASPAKAQNAAKTSTAASSPTLFHIAGRIVNAVTGEPVGRASVALLAQEDSHTLASVESDGEGRFSLERLPAAKYQLTASKRGYRTAFYDEHDEFNSAIVTGPDQDTDHLTFRLVPGGVIRGVVLTDGGDPVENAHVLLFLKPHDGKPGNRVSQSDSTITDDTGAYEFSDLAAGDYLLAVSAEPWYALHPSADRPKKAEAAGSPDAASALDVAYPITYFDSTTDEASATHIQLTGGARVEADINLHAVPAIRIQVEAPLKNNEAASRAELRQTVFGTVISAQSTGSLGGLIEELRGGGGVAEFSGVAPGHYELAQGDPPHVVELNASANMQVDPSLGAPSVVVRGSLHALSGAPLNDDCNLSLEPLSAELSPDPIQTQCIRGSFRFPAVPAGQWQLTGESGGQQLPIDSITVDGRARPGNLLKVADQQLSILVAVAQGAARIEGFARREGKGVSGAMVVLVPANAVAMQSLYRRDQSDSDGSFSLRDVAPGRYTLVALEDAWSLDWADPRVMSRYLPGGIPVTVSDDSGKTMTLTASVPVQNR